MDERVMNKDDEEYIRTMLEKAAVNAERGRAKSASADLRRAIKFIDKLIQEKRDAD
jgi:hypothetical protein